MSSLEWWQIFIAGLTTLAIFSFLIKENSYYRFFEHLYIGIATGIGTMAVIRSFLLPQVIKPLLGNDRLLLPDGTYDIPYHTARLLFLVPMVFGCFYYFLYSRRLAWLAQLVIGFSLGVSGGLAFKAIFNEMFPQLIDSFRPLYVANPTPESSTAANIIFVFTLLTSMSYFFFTFRRKDGGIASLSAASGRMMMMICFGAFFGATVMARMALLVERLDFLLNTWMPALW